MLSLLFLSLSTCLVSCVTTVTIPNTTQCTVAGKLEYGGLCAETETSNTSAPSYEKYLDWLEPASAPYPDPDAMASPAPLIPAHGPAVCESSDDFTAETTVLEQACRDLGDKCVYQIKQVIEQRKTVRELLKL